MDAMRTVKRLGADAHDSTEDREHMPAHEFEADEALMRGKNPLVENY